MNPDLLLQKVCRVGMEKVMDNLDEVVDFYLGNPIQFEESERLVNPEFTARWYNKLSRIYHALGRFYFNSKHNRRRAQTL